MSRRLVLVLVASCVTLTVFLAERFATAAVGDVNGDGSVNALDVQLTINAALGNDIGGPDADINADGTINALDVQLCINAALGITGGGNGEGEEVTGYWVEATPAAPWAGRHGHAATVHNGAMYVLAGAGETYYTYYNDVWSSTDGVTWTERTANAEWPARHRPGCASFNGKLWVMGGYSRDLSRPLSDVWCSSDGAAWEKINGAMPWGDRKGFSVVVFQGKMWIVDGNQKDVWNSEDGENWTEVTDEPAWGAGSGRGGLSCVVRDDRLWVIGGNSEISDAWWSEDGLNWTEATHDAPWPGRSSHASAVYHDLIFLFGGCGRGETLDDAWYSFDAIRWWRMDGYSSWGRRQSHQALVFDDRIWVLGGIDVVTGTRYNDVWHYEGLLECEPAMSNRAPTLTLCADPPTGPAPHTVFFEADAQDRNCDPLTYLWDTGNGVPEVGPENIMMTFDQNGTYTVSVTVSDGEFETTDTATVIVMDVPTETRVVDTAGGSLSLGQCEVTVPPDTAPEALEFGITEFPSMASSAERRLDGSLYAPFGPSYRIDTPLQSDTPFAVTLEYDPADLPPGFSGDHLGALLRVVTKTDPDPVTGRPPQLVVDYVVLPVSASTEDNRVDFDMFLGGTVQLVALQEPLDVVEDNPGAKADGLNYTIVYNGNPTKLTKAIYSATVGEAILAAYAYLVDLKGFPGPVGEVNVIVKALANANGSVPVDNPLILNLDTGLDADTIRTVLPHEFFHVIQGHCNNTISALFYFNEDAWFDEGTAEWASDQIYDLYPDSYTAPDDDRFREPLNHPFVNGKSEYQTVGFWKWVETKYADTVRSALLNQQFLTRVPSASGELLQLPGLYTRQFTFLNVLPDPDFLEFCGAALFWKNFDTNETLEGDLWHSDNLGAPRNLPGDFDFQIPERVYAGNGDSEDNAQLVTYKLSQSLTADVKIVGNPPESAVEWQPLNGKLHIKWAQTSNGQSYDAMVIARKGSSDYGVKRVRDLSQAHEDTTVPWLSDPDYQVIVILVDPRWNVAPTSAESSESFKVWVEGCGPAPGTIIDVSTIEELENACRTAAPGNTIRLAEGSYTLRSGDWTIPGFSETHAGLLVKGVTLMGAGPDKTSIHIPGGQYSDAVEIMTYGNAEIRNLSICLNNSFAIVSHGSGLRLCNVALNDFAPDPSDVISHWPLVTGLTQIEIRDCVLVSTTSNSTCLYIGFSNTLAGPGAGSTVCTIKDTVITGWEIGVEWNTGPTEDFGLTTVIADCEYIAGNEEYNVVQHVCHSTEPHVYYCDQVEHCPEPDSE